jgi:signal transduction histidine kinase
MAWSHGPAETSSGSTVARANGASHARTARPAPSATAHALDLSHDVRESVAVLRLLIEGASDGVLDLDADSPYLERMKVHVLFLSDLVNQLSSRAVRALDKDTPTIPIPPTGLGALLEQWSEVEHRGARVKDVEIRTSIEPDLPAVPCRPQQISRVILNLVDNAVHRSPAQGVVILRALAQPEGVQVQVNDGGPGIPPDVSMRILRASSHGGDHLDGGFGVGLLTARRIVESHGGRLWFAAPTRGASVRFFLPTLNQI